MPKGYNYLSTIKSNDYEIGVCPVCNLRLTAECEHSNNEQAQEWLAAHIAAEAGATVADLVDEAYGTHYGIVGGGVMELRDGVSTQEWYDSIDEVEF